MAFPPGTLVFATAVWGLCLTIAGQDAASYGAEPTCAMIVGDNS